MGMSTCWHMHCSPTASSSASTVCFCPLPGLFTALPSAYPRLAAPHLLRSAASSRDHVPGGRLRPLSAFLCLGGTLLSSSKFSKLGGLSLLAGISQCMFSVMYGTLPGFNLMV